MPRDTETNTLERERPGEAAEVGSPPSGALSSLTRVNVNIPTILVQAITAIAKRLNMNRTDVIVRALSREAYFAKLEVEDPNAKFIVERSNGDRQEVVFLG
jgi:hypothetical protein